MRDNPSSLDFVAVRHKKRGTTYEVLGEAEMQVSTGELVYGTIERPIREGDLIVVYRGENGKLWARFSDEFRDGRFEQISAASPAPFEWRTMESAPKDGTKVDLWARDGRITDAYWSDLQDAWCTDGAYGPEEPQPIAAIPKPTRWMPLPTPPALTHSDKSKEEVGHG